MTIRRFDGEHRFLSNFYYHEDGFTLEHYYQAAKCVDPRAAARIMEADSPGQAKRMGQRVELRPDWEDVKLIIMARLVNKKFDKPRMERLLIATVPHVLIEGNTWGDRFWGQVDGEGENWLGRLLMLKRSSLIERRSEWR